MADDATPAARESERVAARLRRVMRLLGRHAPEDWTALELTMAQMKVLFVLHHGGPAKVSDLAEALAVTAPSMTGTLERLVRQGLVERRDDPADRRLVINALTPAGQALVERLHQGRQARLQAALAHMDAADIAALERGLAGLAAALEENELHRGGAAKAEKDRIGTGA